MITRISQNRRRDTGFSRPCGGVGCNATYDEKTRILTYNVPIDGGNLPMPAEAKSAIFGRFERDRGAQPGSPEDIVSDPQKTILGAAKAATDAIGNAAYTVAPDSCGLSCSIPVLGGLGVDVSKDFSVFGSYSRDAPSDFSGIVDFASGLRPSIGCQAGCSYFIPSVFADDSMPDYGMSAAQRDSNIVGTDLEIQGGIFTYEHSLNQG